MSPLGFIIAVPYANERFLPENFYTGLLQLTSQQNNDGLPVVMMAHTTVAGCDYSSHRNASERNVGGIDSVNLGIFGDSYDYLALGHIHHPQNLSPRARYSGTPMAISFDEQFQHSVTIVDIEQQGSMPTQRIVPISELRPLVTLPDGDPIPFDDALAMLKDFPDDTKAYIRLNVHIENFLPPNANAQAHSATDGKECRFCHINIKRDLQRQNKETGMSVSELQQISPLDLARRFTTEKGLSFDEELFREIC